MEHNMNLKNLTYNVWQMMLEGFSFSVNSGREASPCLYYISFVSSCYSAFLSWAYCNAILKEIFLYVVYYIQCVKQNFLPLLYLVDQRAKSIKVWDFGVSNIFLKALIFEWPKNGLVKSEPVHGWRIWQNLKTELDRFLPQDEQLLFVYHDSLFNPCPWFSLVRNRDENEYHEKYWLR